MDEAIENGYTRLVEIISTQKTIIDEKGGEIAQKNADLFGRMIAMAVPIVSYAGIQMLQKAKIDVQGELYDAVHYDEKMILLGKSEEAVPARPDDYSKKVTDQFCMLGESGIVYELMYSQDEHIVDSYRGELTPGDAVTIYGYDILFMLYKAMRQYCSGQEELLDALDKTLTFMRSFPNQEQ